VIPHCLAIHARAARSNAWNTNIHPTLFGGVWRVVRNTTIFATGSIGGIDGAVTTLAVVTGVAGAQLSNWIIRALGFANLFADGFSMAASNYLGTRSEHDDWRRLQNIENRHIDLAPEGEREEVRQIFARKGFEGEELRRIVELITADRARWVQTMLMDEYGLPNAIRSPWTAAFCTFTLSSVQ
jgi:vacuolar iron transporter family protein